MLVTTREPGARLASGSTWQRAADAPAAPQSPVATRPPGSPAPVSPLAKANSDRQLPARRGLERTSDSQRADDDRMRARSMASVLAAQEKETQRLVMQRRLGN